MPPGAPTCPRCAAPLSTPLLCESCGALLEADGASSPFELLGTEARFRIDPSAVRKRLLALSRRMHPDFFDAADAPTRALAERNTAELNAAYEVLTDDFRRADWLVRHLRGPSETEERQMPREFLAEVLEWNEAVEAARESAPGSPARTALVELGRSLATEHAGQIEALGALLTPLPPAGSPALTEARRRLNAVRYLDRTLHEIGELRLAQASSARPGSP